MYVRNVVPDLGTMQLYGFAFSNAYMNYSAKLKSIACGLVVKVPRTIKGPEGMRMAKFMSTAL